MRRRVLRNDRDIPFQTGIIILHSISRVKCNGSPSHRRGLEMEPKVKNCMWGLMAEKCAERYVVSFQRRPICVADTLRRTASEEKWGNIWPQPPDCGMWWVTIHNIFGISLHFDSEASSSPLQFATYSTQDYIWRRNIYTHERQCGIIYSTWTYVTHTSYAICPLRAQQRFFTVSNRGAVGTLV